MSSLKVQRFSNTEMERQPGEVARLRILKGPDRGGIFIVRDSSVILGRGEEAHVRVSDVKTSRVHARLDYTNQGWVVTDLGSANGIFSQGEFIRKMTVKSGEHFTLGETIFEFLTSDQETRILTAPLKKGEEVEQMDFALMDQKKRVQNYSKAPKQPLVAKGSEVDQSSKKRTLLMIAALVGLYFYFGMGDDAPKAPSKIARKKKDQDKERGLAAETAETVDLEVAKTAEQYYRQGFREYREGNYMRAKAQFELALQVNPNHGLARHYLLVAEQDIKSLIEKTIELGRKSKYTGRLRESKGFFEAAMRLMYNDQSNPDFIECEEEVKKINKELERMPVK